MEKINIAMAWWWTGWHVFPIKSLIQHIYKHPQYFQKIQKIVRFGEKRSLEYQVFQDLKQDHKSLFFQSIISWKYRRETWFSSRIKNIRDMFKFTYWVLQSIHYFKKHKIHILFCKWWYVALPVVFAAKLLHKKIIVHESDVRSWLVNKIASKYADQVFTGFDWVLPKSTTVGQILSDDIINHTSIKNIPQENLLEWQELTPAQKLFYTDPQKTHLLVIWWSQWSKRLYQNLLQSIDENYSIYQNYEIFIILWKENKNLKSEFSKYKNIHTFDFVSQGDMWLLLKHCDISLTRAGTTSLAEQKLFNLKIVMVPIPWTHDQYDNAKFYVKKHGDILLDSKDPNYQKNMSDIFKKYKDFKKKNSKKDIFWEIQSAKDIIIKAILSTKTWHK